VSEQAVRFASPVATTLRWSPTPIVYGLGATREIGHELRSRGLARVAIVTDTNIVAAGLVDEITGYIRAAGADAIVWSGSEVEATESSILRAVDELAPEQFDGFIALGGGSCIDTCKIVNLLSRYPADLVSYIVRPQGEGRQAPGALRPMIGVPTTAGPGAESTSAAALDSTSLGGKGSIVDPALSAAVAIIDPLNTITAPAAATASAGYDALIQSIESYTSRAFDQVPAVPSYDRPPMVGANPLSDPWCERAIELCGRYLTRAVHNGYDVEARVGMTQASMFSRLGAAGAHVPHAIAPAVAAISRDYVPPGFIGLERPLVPHGQAVVAAAAEAFAFTYAGAPDRHRRAAQLLGITDDELTDAGGEALASWIQNLVAATGGPTGLRTFGLHEGDIPELARRAHEQRRLLPRSPRPVTEADLADILTRSLGNADLDSALNRLAAETGV
jgi:hydroxyacid-oxoacid transhydrogenase